LGSILKRPNREPIMRKIRSYVVPLLISLLVAAGCASKEKFSIEGTRERADRAFDDLRAEERGRDAVRPSTESDTVQREAVQVTKGKRPDWIDGESAQYPISRYLTGVGYGPDRKSSEDNARAEIAKIFFSKVESRTRSYQEYLQTASKGRSRREEASSIDEITKVSTQKVLSGVRISHVYQESGPEPLFYALAVLDRDQSTKILRDKIQQLDQDIRGLINRAEAEGDMLAKIKYLKQSMQKHILREAYDAELRIVSPSGSGMSLPIQFTEIKSGLEAILLRDFLIGVSVTGSRAGEIQDALVQGLNQQGFSIGEDLSRANVLVRGTVEIKALDRGTAEWKYVRWRTHFDLVDNAGGSVFGSVDKTGREGHLSIPQAENRAVRKIRKALTTEIAEEMRRYIFSQ